MLRGWPQKGYDWAGGEVVGVDREVGGVGGRQWVSNAWLGVWSSGFIEVLPGWFNIYVCGGDSRSATHSLAFTHIHTHSLAPTHTHSYSLAPTPTHLAFHCLASCTF